MSGSMRPCTMCRNKKQYRVTNLVLCSGIKRNGQGNCGAWVHPECFGFKSIEEIPEEVNYFCPDHDGSKLLPPPKPKREKSVVSLPVSAAARELRSRTPSIAREDAKPAQPSSLAAMVIQSRVRSEPVSAAGGTKRKRQEPVVVATRKERKVAVPEVALLAVDDESSESDATLSRPSSALPPMPDALPEPPVVAVRLRKSSVRPAGVHLVTSPAVPVVKKPSSVSSESSVSTSSIAPSRPLPPPKKEVIEQHSAASPSAPAVPIEKIQEPLKTSIDIKQLGIDLAMTDDEEDEDDEGATTSDPETPLVQLISSATGNTVKKSGAVLTPILPLAQIPVVPLDVKEFCAKYLPNDDDAMQEVVSHLEQLPKGLSKEVFLNVLMMELSKPAVWCDGLDG